MNKLYIFFLLIYGINLSAMNLDRLQQIYKKDTGQLADENVSWNYQENDHDWLMGDDDDISNILSNLAENDLPIDDLISFDGPIDEYDEIVIELIKYDQFYRDFIKGSFEDSFTIYQHFLPIIFNSQRYANLPADARIHRLHLEAASKGNWQIVMLFATQWGGDYIYEELLLELLKYDELYLNFIKGDFENSNEIFDYILSNILRLERYLLLPAERRIKKIHLEAGAHNNWQLIRLFAANSWSLDIYDEILNELLKYSDFYHSFMKGRFDKSYDFYADFLPNIFHSERYGALLPGERIRSMHHEAAWNDNWQISDVVYDYSGIDINDFSSHDIYGYTLLHIAAENNRDRAMETLLEYGADPNAQSKQGRKTPLHLVVKAKRRHNRCLELLISNNVDVTISDGNRRTALHLAARAGYVEAVKRILEMAPPQMRSAPDRWGNTPLNLANQLRNTKKGSQIRKLLESSASLASANPEAGEENASALVLLDTLPQEEVPQHELDHDINITPDELPQPPPEPIHWLDYLRLNRGFIAPEETMQQVIDLNLWGTFIATIIPLEYEPFLLYDYYLPALRTLNLDGYELMFAAAQQNNWPLAMKTREHFGLDINGRDQFGRSLFELACSLPHIDIHLIEILINAQADIREPLGPDRVSILHLMVRQSQPNDIFYLLNMAPDLIYLQDRLGNTALQFAIALGRAEIVALLLQRNESNRITAVNFGFLWTDIRTIANHQNQRPLEYLFFYQGPNQAVIGQLFQNSYAGVFAWPLNNHPGF